MKKWKWNWGTGIALSLVLFASGMGYALYRVFTMRYDLVREDYYQAEMEYEATLQGKRNAAALQETCRLVRQDGQLKVDFPAALEGDTAAIKLQMYFLTDARADFTLEQESWPVADYVLPTEKLRPGKWIAKIELQGLDQPYYFEPSIRLP
ncbi:MAG: FixH family protein [Schleiferiaceae bacterium]|nr:FixH family protein [Schleiferiaceae bacterium]